MYRKKIITLILFLSLANNISADGGGGLDLLLFNTVLSISREGLDSGDIEKLEYLLKSGANPNILVSDRRDIMIIPSHYRGSGFLFYIYGETSPLMIARPIEVVDLLIKYGAEINLQNNIGRTALMVHSYFYEWGDGFDENTFSLLVNNGADVNIRDNLGRTALYYAIGADQILSTIRLIESGASVNIEDNNGYTPFQVVSYFPWRTELSSNQKILISILESAGAENTFDAEKMFEKLGDWSYFSHYDLPVNYADR